MAKGLAVLAVALFTLTFASGAPARGARKQDLRATRAYLTAQHKAAFGFEHAKAMEPAAVAALISHAETQCPNVLAGAPGGGAVLREEAFDEVESTGIQFSAPALRAFARAIDRLRWSNPRLTLHVHQFGEAEIALANITVPDICVDAEAFIASHFQTIPHGFAVFRRQREAWEHLLEIHEPGHPSEGLVCAIQRLMKPYERANDRALMPRSPSAKSLQETLAANLAAFRKLAVVLGMPENLNPPE